MIELIFYIFTGMKNLILIFSFVLAFVTASAQETEKDSTELTIRTWKLTEDFTQTSTINLDTVLTGFQVYNQMYNKNIYPAYLGNLGTAGISNSYFMRKNSLNPIVPSFQLGRSP